MLTEQTDPAFNNLDSLDAEQALRLMNSEDRKVAEAVAAQIPHIARAVDAVVAALQAGGRLFYIGAGTSGRLGVLDAAECPPTFNVPPSMVQGVIAGGERALSRAAEASEDDPLAGEADLLARGFTSADVLVGIAASGRTPYVLGAMGLARRLGARTVGISCTPDSELAKAADIAISPLTGPEVVAGSTRLKAGTATKLILNMISTVSMVRLRYLYGNLMINVRPTSSKLRDRAVRIVSRVAGVSDARAAELLDAAGDVKTAILMGRLGLGREEAVKRLESVGGHLSGALGRG
ncbi:MAG: N-acetylmuramic acid 6-phosphate etherase [Bryobacterales bacterium]|nr:N-acetylmuramic acid 6-phosphate etherase [Bryobacterales bacterium]